MKNQAWQKRHSQSGSIFFWIFFMVILFAGLSFALTQGFRGSSATVTTEQTRLLASEIVNYMQTIKNAVKQLEIGNGCSVTEINFSTNVYLRRNGSLVDNPPPSPRPECALYGQSGGKINPIVLDRGLTPNYVPPVTDWNPGSFGARFMNVSGVGTSANDLTYFAKGFSTEVCLAVLNMMAGTEARQTIEYDSNSWGSSSNSYTQGASYSSLDITPYSMVVSFYPTVAQNYCNIGIILKSF